MKDKQDFEHIGWAYGAADISLVSAAFEAAEITCFIHGATAHQVLSDWAVAMGGARVMVPPEHTSTGRALLTQCLSAEPLCDRRSKSFWGIFLLTGAFFLSGLATGIMPMHSRFIAVRNETQTKPVSG